MIGPRLLTDVLVIDGQDVPAYVGTVEATTEWSGSGWIVRDRLNAVVAPGTDVTEGQDVTWRGRGYKVAGVMNRRRPTATTDHHLSLRLEGQRFT